MIIAIDGPAGSGKSSTAKAVARELGFRHLRLRRVLSDTDLRCTARGLASGNVGLGYARTARFVANRFGAGGNGHHFTMNGRDITAEIRSPEVNAHVSQMARVPAVRFWLLDQLRSAGKESDLVADGRDIGTVVFPDAELKIFLVARPEVRAERRLREHGIEKTAEKLAQEAHSTRASAIALTQSVTLLRSSARRMQSSWTPATLRFTSRSRELSNWLGKGNHETHDRAVAPGVCLRLRRR